MGVATPDNRRGGILFGLAAYGIWGLIPLYFSQILRAIGPGEMLAHRVVWSVAVLGVPLTGLRRWPAVAACIRSRQLWPYLAASTMLIAANWYVFSYGVWSRQVIETSLGYFILPLLSVLLGMVFFQERLHPAQWAALAIATAGIVYFVAHVGRLPWIALTVAGTFSLYGMVRKLTPVDALVGVTAEVVLLLPAAAAALVIWGINGTGAFGGDRRLTTLLLLSGVATVLPLVLFGAAARRLPLVVLGFLQFISPSLACLGAVFFLGEQFRMEQGISFGLTWLALVIISVEAVHVQRMKASQRSRAAAPAGQGDRPA